MECIQCGHKLFGLREPRCPECGEWFNVLAYRYDPNEVYFACPYCMRRYEGGGRDGHPRNLSPACDGCGKPIFAARMTVMAITDDAEAILIAGRTPWDAWKAEGFFKIFLKCWRMLLFEPGKFFRPMPECDDYSNALLFAVLVTGISMMGKALIANPIDERVLGTALLPVTFIPKWGACCMSTVWIVGKLSMLLLIWSFVLGGVVHGTLVLLGWAGSTFTGTVQGMLFAVSGMCLLAVPVLGIPLALAWSLWIASVGLARTHQVSTWQAALPTFCWAGLLLIICGGPAVLLRMVPIGKILSALKATPGPTPVPLVTPGL